MSLPTKGIQYLVAQLIGNTNAQSLAVNDAAALVTGLATVEEGFLAKRTRYILSMSLLDLDINALLYINSPSASSVETEAAIEATATDPDDFSDMSQFMARKGVIWSTIFHLAASMDAVTSNAIAIDSGWLQVGKKGKGIPYGEGIGPELHIYNMDDSIIPADVIFNGLFIVEGVWLRG